MFGFTKLVLIATALTVSSAALVKKDHDWTKRGAEHSPAKRSVLDIGPGIITTGNSLINSNILADVLSPSQCTGTAVVGLKANIQILNLLHVCSCVEVLNSDSTTITACPTCPKNASPICAQNLGTGTCGCECDIGYYATVVDGAQVCVPTTSCASPNTLVQLGNGKSNCTCARGFLDDLLGGCISACLVAESY